MSRAKVGQLDSWMPIVLCIHRISFFLDVAFSARPSAAVKTSVQHESVSSGCCLSEHVMFFNLSCLINKLLVDENSFFTIDQEGMCRCWDEYDKSERYSFRAKGTQVYQFAWKMSLFCA